MKDNTDLEPILDVERYRLLTLRLVIELADFILGFEEMDRKRTNRSPADLAAETLFSIAGMFDQASSICIDGNPVKPVISFRDCKGNSEEEALLVPGYAGYLKDFVYPIMKLLETRPDLRAALASGDMSMEKLEECDRLIGNS